jgi:threonylcarbamoyladenosine tRNA methylthiotransferase MtaB
MARKTTPESFSQLVAAARAACPEIAITTDVIVGFPGETEAEFEESLAFIRAMQFAGGHVFTYSARPETAAARMPGQVPHPVRKERNARLRAVLAESAREYQQRFLSATLPVLWESAVALGPHEWHMSGLTDNYLRVNTHAPRHLWNQITPVLLTGIESGQMSGKVLSG